MLTTIAAYGSFILAERVHVSPVIAVLLTGMIIGNYGRRQGMSPNTEVAVDSFWGFSRSPIDLQSVFLSAGSTSCSGVGCEDRSPSPSS